MLVTLYVLPWLGYPFLGTHWPSLKKGLLTLLSLNHIMMILGATKNQMNNNSWELRASTKCRNAAKKAASFASVVKQRSGNECDWLA
jgi:hypothetical protein